MWRSRVLAAGRIRSVHKNAIRGFSNSSSDFPHFHSKVHIFQTLGSSFPQSNATRLFSSSSTDSITYTEVNTDNNNDAISNENDNSFNMAEMLNDGINEVNSVSKMNRLDSEIQESMRAVVNDEAHEIDNSELDRVLSLLKSIDDDFDAVTGSLESSLNDMNLNLNEEFVVRVLESTNIPSESLIVFFKWAAGDKNQEMFSITSKSLNSLVKAVCSELKKKVAYKLWDLVKEIGEKENNVVTTEMLNALISVFSRLGKGMTGYEVFNKFGDFSCEKSADSYYFTIEALCRRSILDRVNLVCESMLNEEKLPEAKKIGNIICYLCKSGMVKEAHSVYLSANQKQKYPPQSSVNFLISSLCDCKKNDSDSVHLALNMLEDFYNGEKQKHAIKQFSCVIQGLCRVNDIQGAKSVLSKMIESGPPPGNAVFNTIINALSKSGNMSEAIKIMRIMEDRGLKPDVFAYSVIMSGYVKVGQMEEAIKMLTEAKKNHCKLTPVTYHTIIRGYCKIGKFEKAVKLLQEMENYGVNPNTDEYNKLIQSVCLKAVDWKMAEKLMEEMAKKGLYLNGITKSLVRAVKELEKEAIGTE